MKKVPLYRAPGKVRALILLAAITASSVAVAWLAPVYERGPWPGTIDRHNDNHRGHQETEFAEATDDGGQLGGHRTYHVPYYLVAAVPFFVILVLVELFVSWNNPKPLYRFTDSVSSMSAGAIQLLSDVVIYKPLLGLGLYVYVFEHYRIVNVPLDGLGSWLVVFLFVDMVYYWFHRWAHEVNIIWAAHAVHHSSEEYNLSTALRQSVFQKFFSTIIYLPAALFFHPVLYVVHSELNVLFQFWIHTQVIDDLGPLEWILNTPSHHRVHHGRNPYCIDKNYGGTLIIWDKLFGTFAAEDREDEVVYGLVHPLATYDPFWTQVHHYVWIAQGVWNTEGVFNKCSRIWQGPGWNPGQPRLGDPNELPPVDARTAFKFHTQPAALLYAYTFIHFVIATVLTVLVVVRDGTWPFHVTVIAAAFVVFTYWTLGNLVTGTRNMWFWENFRVVVLVTSVLALLALTGPVAAAGAGVAATVTSTVSLLTSWERSLLHVLVGVHVVLAVVHAFAPTEWFALVRIQCRIYPHANQLEEEGTSKNKQL